MDSSEPAITIASVGELTCGCWFDLEGTHEAGDWIICRGHRAPARVTAASPTVCDGLIG